jgi:hypothetical protein
MEVTARELPFRHWLIDGMIDAQRVGQIHAALPPADWPGWEARYENDCERGKRTCRDRAALPEPIAAELAALNGMTWLGYLRCLTEIPELTIDPHFHGAGLHVTEPGGWLSPHLDYALHPKLPDMERRVNLVLFLNPTWRAEWGGAFELGDDIGNPIERVLPAPGQAVVWLPSDVAYHGTQRVAGDAPPRATLAVYYLAPARPGAVRKRALFIPNRRAG